VTADATTMATLQNIAPTLAAVGDRDVIEGQTLAFDLVAEDSAGRVDLLRFSFVSAVPRG